MNEQLETFLSKENITYETRVDLKKKTWIHRGGTADYFVIPSNASSLLRVMSFLYDNDIQHLLIGCTSNLYILNSTDIPVVVSTLKCNAYEIKNGVIECESGVMVSMLARQMINQGISGFEYLTKLPGTVGAAIYNNSSVKCEKNSITELLIDLDIITPLGVYRIAKDDLHFSFRSSDFKRHIIKGTILRARLKTYPGDVNVMRQVARSNEEERARVLEGSAHNLGCTVNMPFCNGRMPLLYRLLNAFFAKLVGVFVKDNVKQRIYKKKFLFTITGYKNLIPYVSDKSIITFIWKDEKADEVFNEYLSFMKDIFKTDKIEIEIF